MILPKLKSLKPLLNELFIAAKHFLFRSPHYAQTSQVINVDFNSLAHLKIEINRYLQGVQAR